MKKITITLLSLIASASFAQETILANWDDVNPQFEFCFDAPEPNECTTSRVANNDQTGVNSSAIFLESVAPTTGDQFNYGIQARLNAPEPTLNSGGNFLSILFRSNQNPTGNLSVTAQIIVDNGMGNIRAQQFNSYTATDGSWQQLTFDFSLASTQFEGGFDADTLIELVGVNVDNGNATGFTYGLDEIILSTDPVLSTGDFAKDDVSVYPIPATIAVNIRGDISGNTASIYDLTGSLVSTAAITGDFNSVDVSALAKGVYFLQLENGSVLKFVK